MHYKMGIYFTKLQQPRLLKIKLQKNYNVRFQKTFLTKNQTALNQPHYKSKRGLVTFTIGNLPHIYPCT